MSLAKLPGFKGLVSSSQGRRHGKSELSADMISPPLGDFRHTMHVGRGGDVFGDTSFLSEHGGGGGKEQTSPDSRTARFFSRTLRHVKPRPRRGSREVSPPPPEVSPIIKNAVSLPQLHLSATNGGLKRTISSSAHEGQLYSYGIHSGFVTLPRPSRLDRNSTESPPLPDPRHRDSLLDEDDSLPLTRSDSLTSFTVDLGPSLMSEVLGLIDQSGGPVGTDPDLDQEDQEEEEEEPSSLFEMAVESLGTRSPSNSTVSTPQRGSSESSSRGRSSSPEWARRPTEETGGDRDGDGGKRVTPDASLQSPLRPEPTIEAARFHRAADMLERHYGGGRSGSTRRTRAPYAFPEEEEEVKV